MSAFSFYDKMMLDILEKLKIWLLSIFYKNENIEKEYKEMLSLKNLITINNNLNKNECEYYHFAFNKILPEFEINTNLRLCHFLAQVLHESGHLKYKIENLNYSASALRSVFGKYFKTDAEANAYARQPEKIANKVYANRMGNGDEASGDGWRYRGRGLLQLTGRCNYAEASTYLGLDLITCPDLITDDPVINLKVACWFWNKHKLNQYADCDDVLTITKKINGGTNGLDDRKKILSEAKKVLY